MVCVCVYVLASVRKNGNYITIIMLRFWRWIKEVKSQWEKNPKVSLENRQPVSYSGSTK